MLIAIDGPAASGKGALGKLLAQHFRLRYLDTGRLYRAVGYELSKRIGMIKDGPDQKAIDIAEEIAKNLNLVQVDNEEIETEEVGRAASIVSAIPEVRGALFEFQRNFANSPEGAVLDGRDIGTVICPNANYKFFITAEPEIRANRRFKQLQLKKKAVIEADILRDIVARDERDREREVAPLIPAIDAIYIDTSDMSIEQVFDKMVSIIDSNASC